MPTESYVEKPRASLAAHKESPVSCSRRAEKAEDQTPDLKISSKEAFCQAPKKIKLPAEESRYTKVRTWPEKDWDSAIWDGDIWVGSFQAALCVVFVVV